MSASFYVITETIITALSWYICWMCGKGVGIGLAKSYLGDKSWETTFDMALYGAISGGVLGNLLR